MDYQRHTLKNGLRVITVPMANVASATVMILVGVGSRYEKKEANGVTHFLEHMLFKGTKKRPSAHILSEIIDSIGGEWNAATGKESTVYYIKAASSHLDQIFDILCDMLTSPLLDKKEIEREKGVIMQEISMYEDTPNRRVGEIFEMLLYPNSSLGWDIAGTPATVKAIARADFDDLYARFYHPENMVVVISGGIHDRNALELVNKYLGKLRKVPDLKAKSAKRKSVDETFIQTEPQVLLQTKKTDQAHITLGFRGHARGHPDRWAEEVLASVLGGGMSSRLFVQVRERRGLAYYVRADLEHYQDNGYFGIYAGISPRKMTQAIRVILEECAKMAKTRLGESELKKGKEFVKGHLALSLEDTRNVAGFLGGFEILEKNAINPTDVAKNIDRVTAADVQRVAKEFFVQEKLNLAVIGPYRNAERFKKMLSQFV